MFILPVTAMNKSIAILKKLRAYVIVNVLMWLQVTWTYIHDKNTNLRCQSVHDTAEYHYYSEKYGVSLLMHRKWKRLTCNTDAASDPSPCFMIG